MSQQAAPVPHAERRALLIDVGHDTAALLALWLGAGGFRVLAGAEAEAEVGAPPALVFAESAYPRRGEERRLAQIRRRWPGAPVILLSPTLFPNVPARGEVARMLGVAAALATPLTQARLMQTIAEVLGS
ncbi:hypothetical protein PEC18_23915 [Paucibacter sp. O1-1]|nr:hypothetical protein [Paucibacter sp. O1-1]MDA3828793.1 hypothetical protein [Paucibacter sp. O1-1]